MDEYAAHNNSITGIILYAYTVNAATGLLQPNPKFSPLQCEAYFDTWRAIAPIYAAIGGQSLGATIANSSTEQNFIDVALDKAKTHELQGYSFDIEGSAKGPSEFLPFLDKFAQALHSEGMTLTSNIDGCPQGAEGITCAQYHASSVDAVNMMGWYKAEPGAKFAAKVANTVASLGAEKTMAGWSGSHWMHNCTMMDLVLSHGIFSLGYWADSLRTDNNWDLIGEFLTYDLDHPLAPWERWCGKPHPHRNPNSTAIAKPSALQLEWFDADRGALITWNPFSHCVPNTSSLASSFGCLGCQKGKGIVAPKPSAVLSTVYPRDMDMMHIVEVASTFASYALLVVNQRLGFSLWPTKANNFSISYTKYKGGDGDIVAEFVAACKHFGVKPGIFYTAHWNAYNTASYGPRDLTDAEQDEFNVLQLTELMMGKYEKMFELWLDGGLRLHA